LAIHDQDVVPHTGDVAELPERLATRLGLGHSFGHQARDARLEMERELVVDFALDAPVAERDAKDSTHSHSPLY
jgi:hypothetical protein